MPHRKFMMMDVVTTKPDRLKLWYAVRKVALKAWRVTPEGIFWGDLCLLPVDKVRDFLDDRCTLNLKASPVKIKVGVMNVKVTPGPDKKFGTADDKVEISSDGWDYKAVADGFKCRYCNKVLKTEKGMEKHVDNYVCREEK